MSSWIGELIKIAIRGFTPFGRNWRKERKRNRGLFVWDLLSIVLQSEDRGQVSSGHEARPPTAVAGAAVDVVGVSRPMW